MNRPPVSESPSTCPIILSPKTDPRVVSEEEEEADEEVLVVKTSVLWLSSPWI